MIFTGEKRAWAWFIQRTLQRVQLQGCEARPYASAKAHGSSPPWRRWSHRRKRHTDIPHTAQKHTSMQLRAIL